MEHHVAEYLLGVFVVVAELRAAIVVGKSEDAVDTLGSGLSVDAVHYLLDDAVDASHCGDDPELVADAYLPVGTHIAAKCRFLAFESRAGSGAVVAVDGYVGVVELTLEVGLDVVVVEEMALGYGVARVTDGKSVFDDVFALGDVAQGKFMTRGNVAYERDVARAFDADHSALGQRVDGYGHIVGGIDFEKILHEF